MTTPVDGFYYDVISGFGWSARAPLNLPPVVVPPPAPVPFDPPLPADSALDYVAQAKSRVITQYREAVRLLAELTALVGIVQEIENALIDVKGLDDYLDAGAGGLNLDVSGEIVNQPRRLTNGTDVADALYRTLITARIARNRSRASNPELLAAIVAIVGSGIIYTDYSAVQPAPIGMDVSFLMPRAPTSDEAALLGSDLMPRPMGVRLLGAWYDPTNFFGYAGNPSAHGYGVGKYATGL